MEMHQIRYFLAVTRTLNFTRAAEECNVAQPSLTRAIKQLEAELGGDLFRRERPAAQLTELGQRMEPLLKQCFEAATGARALATSFKGGKIGTLRIAIANAVDIALLIPHLNQLKRMFSTLEFRLLRGSSKDIGEYLKTGEAELGIAVEIDQDWDRLDSWPLFTEGFDLVVNEKHPLASRGDVGFDDGFFNAEFWCLPQDGSTELRLIEINGRAAACFSELYRGCLDVSHLSALVDVAGGTFPRALQRPNGRVGGQFNLLSFGRGRAHEFLDFEAAREFPEVVPFREPEEEIEPVSEFGTVLGQFELFGASYEEIHARAQGIRGRLLRKG